MSILKEAPAGAPVFDVGQARAARAEARAAAGDPNPVLKLEAGYVEVNPEFNITVGESLSAGKIREALAGLLADPADVDVLIEDGVSAQDLKALIDFLGSSVGESKASPAQ